MRIIVIVGRSLLVAEHRKFRLSRHTIHASNLRTKGNKATALIPHVVHLPRVWTAMPQTHNSFQTNPLARLREWSHLQTPFWNGHKSAIVNKGLHRKDNLSKCTAMEYSLARHLHPLIKNFTAMHNIVRGTIDSRLAWHNDIKNVTLRGRNLIYHNLSSAVMSERQSDRSIYNYSEFCLHCKCHQTWEYIGV